MSDLNKEKLTGPRSKWIEKEQFSIYDPSLGYARKFDKVEGLFTLPGYDLWFSHPTANEKSLKILTLGGSTTDYRAGCKWAAFLANHCRENNIEAVVLNGGCGGYNSHQELLKLYRDSPGLQPNIVICLSGINDFTNWTLKKHPMYNPYQKDVAKFIGTQTDAFDNFTLGIHNEMGSSEFWLRNGRTMRFVLEEQGAKYLQVLQPTLGSSPYNYSEVERGWMTEAGTTYTEAMDKFYNTVKSQLSYSKYDHILDLTQIFLNHSNMYTDCRHPNDKGNNLIAKTILEELINRKYIVNNDNLENRI